MARLKFAPALGISLIKFLPLLPLHLHVIIEIRDKNPTAASPMTFAVFFGQAYAHVRMFDRKLDRV